MKKSISNSEKKLNDIKNYKASKTQLILIVTVILSMMYYIVCLFSRGKYFDSIFFADHNDTFADFFKCVYGWHGNPYKSAGYANYPALGIMMYDFCYHFIPSDVVVADGLAYRNVSSIWIVFILYNASVIWLTSISINEKLRLSKVNKNLFVIALILSFPVMFSLERGNQINLAFAFTIFFYAFQDSDNRIVCELSFISLAIAASLKIYPAIFGAILLKNRRWRDAVRLGLYGVFFFFVPFIYYGKESLGIFVKSLLTFSSSQGTRYGYNFSLKNMFSIASKVCEKLFNFALPKGLFILGMLLIFAWLIYVFLQAKMVWQEWLSLTLLMILIPSISDAYLVLFMIIPWISLISNSTVIDVIDAKYELIMILLFSILFIPWPLPVIYAASTSNYFLTVSYLVYFADMLILVLLSGWCRIFFLKDNNLMR